MNYLRKDRKFKSLDFISSSHLGKKYHNYENLCNKKNYIRNPKISVEIKNLLSKIIFDYN